MTRFLPHLAMFVFVLLISGSFSLGHIAAPFVEPAALNTVRFTFALVLMLSIGLFKFRKLTFIGQAPWRFVILGGLSAVYFITMFIALQYTSAVSTSAVFTLVPLMSTGFGWLFLKEVTALRTWFGLSVAACGAIWIIFKGDLAAIFGFHIGTGELIFLIGCISYAAYAPLIRKLNRREDTYAFTVTTLFACLIITALIGAPDIVETSWHKLPLVVWGVIFYLAIFTTAISFFLLQYASMKLPASKVLSYGYLIPGIVVLYEGLLGNGWANTNVLVGVFVTASILFFTLLSGDTGVFKTRSKGENC